MKLRVHSEHFTVIVSVLIHVHTLVMNGWADDWLCCLAKLSHHVSVFYEEAILPLQMELLCCLLWCWILTERASFDNSSFEHGRLTLIFRTSFIKVAISWESVVRTLSMTGRGFLVSVWHVIILRRIVSMIDYCVVVSNRLFLVMVVVKSVIFTYLRFNEEAFCHGW